MCMCEAFSLFLWAFWSADAAHLFYYGAPQTRNKKPIYTNGEYVCAALVTKRELGNENIWSVCGSCAPLKVCLHQLAKGQAFQPP